MFQDVEQEEGGGGVLDEGDSQGWCKAMNTTTVNVLACIALFVLVVALTLGALMLVVPLVTHELTYSGYY